MFQLGLSCRANVHILFWSIQRKKIFHRSPLWSNKESINNFFGIVELHCTIPSQHGPVWTSEFPSLSALASDNCLSSYIPHPTRTYAFELLTQQEPLWPNDDLFKFSLELWSAINYSLEIWSAFNYSLELWGPHLLNLQPTWTYADLWSSLSVWQCWTVAYTP